MRHLKEVFLSYSIIKLNEIGQGGAQEGVQHSGHSNVEAVRI